MILTIFLIGVDRFENFWGGRRGLKKGEEWSWISEA
jgi:hypothetical protein